MISENVRSESGCALEFNEKQKMNSNGSNILPVEMC